MKICDETSILQENFEDTLQKASSILKLWRFRNLTLVGRTLLFNSLVGSLFVYKMMVLPSVSADLINRFNWLARDFLWKSKRARINLNLLQADKPDGGLRLANLYKKDISLKALWVREIHQNDFFARIFYGQLKTIEKENIWKCQLSVKDARKFVIPNFGETSWLPGMSIMTNR